MAGSNSSPDTGPVIQLREATLRYGRRELWSRLNLDIAPGEFVAVLGPNGSGKTSLLKILLGLQQLTEGTVTVQGQVPRRGSRVVGYVPQQRHFDAGLPVRGRDLVGLGLDGHRWGPRRRTGPGRTRIAEVIADVGAQNYADAPVGLLSGGEQQRLRIAQALVSRPRVLLCDEPLLSLDLHHQQAVSELIDAERRRHRTAIVFVTHELNPILPLVDRVVYFVEGRWLAGSTEEVMTSENLSALYQADISVLKVRGRIVVVGAPDAAHGDGGHHHHVSGDPHSAGL
jgi:zinc/manganese transport system ATP-binding protein